MTVIRSTLEILEAHQLVHNVQHLGEGRGWVREVGEIFSELDTLRSIQVPFLYQNLLLVY